MKIIYLTLLTLLGLFVFVGFSYATCGDLEELSAIHSKCIENCRAQYRADEYGGYYATEGEQECERICDANFNKDLEDWRKCMGEEQQNFGEQKGTEEQELLEQQKATEEQKEEAETKKATISYMRGDVEVLQPDGSWKKITSDTEIKKGDRIRTKADSYAIVAFSDGSRIYLGPNSSVNFSALEFKRELQLLEGKLRIVISKFERFKFKVRTPVAVTAPRGTDFIVEHDSAKSISTIYLNEGTLDVENIKGEKFVLNAGEIMTVDSSGKTEKSELKKDKWDSLLNAVGTGAPEREKLKMMTYLSLILLIVLIIGGIFFSILKKKKPKEVPKETQLSEHQKWVKALTKKIRICALILAAIIVVVGVLSSLGKLNLPQISLTFTTSPTIGQVPAAYSVTYNMIFPQQQGTWKESVRGDSKKIEIETEQILTSIYILGENYYSCTKIFGKWSCMKISEPTYKPSSDPTTYSKEKPVFIGTKNIANRVANCYTVSVGNICLDKETNILLESRAKIEGREFILTATSLNLNPPPQEEFTIPAEPQKIPTITP